MTQTGLDISYYQNGLRLSDINEGYKDFVIIRAGYGNSYRDTAFTNFWGQATDLNMKRSVYWYTYPSYNSALDEANAFYTEITKPETNVIGKGIIVMDFEENVAQATPEWALTFLNRMKELTGIKPFFYSYASLLSQKNFSNIYDAGFNLWCAAYGANQGLPNTRPVPAYWGSNYPLWQYTSQGGDYAGWTSKGLDLNQFEGTDEDWARYAGASPSPTQNTGSSILINM